MAEPAIERKEQRIENHEVLGCIGGLVNEEHERLRQLEVNLDQGVGTSSGSAGR